MRVGAGIIRIGFPGVSEHIVVSYRSIQIYSIMERKGRKHG